MRKTVLATLLCLLVTGTLWAALKPRYIFPVEERSRFVLQSVLDAGAGDMLKSTYDVGENGLIDITAGGTGAATLSNLITLTTHTTGNYVATVADGTGIDGTATGEGSTYTPTIDSTELDALTWSDGSNASNIWTFNVSGTDHTMTAGSALMTFSQNVTVSGTVTAAVFSDTSMTAGSVLFSDGTDFVEDNSNLFWDDANDRLGIGTSSPGSKLHINSTASASTTLLTLESDINQANEYNGILFKVVDGQNYGAIRSCVGGTVGDSYMSFFTTTDGGTLVRQVTIQHNGKVGFGTYNPETLLTMVSAAPYLTLYNNTEEDTDGGGESRIIGKREDGAGTPTAAGQIEISHDGSDANDQLGKIILSVNTGAGLVQALEIGSDLLATFSTGVTIATGQALTVGTTTWTSSDEIDGTKIKDADYGDIDVSAGGVWTVEDDSHAHIYSDIDSTTSANWKGRVSDELGNAGYLAFVNDAAPAKNDTILYNGTDFVCVAEGTTFTFSIATFVDDQTNTQEIGTGVWKTAGNITFTSASYNNGPPDATPYVVQTGSDTAWGSNLNMTTSPAFEGPTSSAEDTNYPAATGAITFTLNAAVGGETDDDVEQVYFYAYIYAGADTDSADTEAMIEAMDTKATGSGISDGKVLSNTETRTFAVVAGANEYIWFAYPSRLGTSTFTVGGFEGGFEAAETLSISNTEGDNWTENYYAYRSTNHSLGTTTVVVSD